MTPRIIYRVCPRCYGLRRLPDDSGDMHWCPRCGGLGQVETEISDETETTR